MKRASILAAIAALVIPLSAASAPDPAPVAIRAARLLDVKAGRYVDRPVVVVRAGLVESVGTAAPAGARVIDLGDRTLLPGLIDTHTHVLLQCYATQASTITILKFIRAPLARAVRAD